MTHNRNRLTVAPITPIVAPMWLGAERHGCEQGATALHEALRALWTPERAGPDAERLQPAIELDCHVPADADQLVDRRDLSFAQPILETARAHACLVREAIRDGSLALTIGGDHALAFGSLTGTAMASERPAVIWLDTHPDLNTPASSPTGHMHGMPLGTAIGAENHAFPQLDELAGRSPMINPANVVLLGIRDIDPGERDLIIDTGVWALTMEEWHDAGIEAGLQQALAYLRDREVTSVVVSFDLDVIDPTVMPGTGTKAPGGLSYREASQVLRRLGEWDGPIQALDMVELNPLLDPTGASTRIAGALLATAVGHRMLPPRD